MDLHEDTTWIWVLKRRDSVVDAGYSLWVVRPLVRALEDQGGLASVLKMSSKGDAYAYVPYD